MAASLPMPLPTREFSQGEKGAVNFMNGLVRNSSVDDIDRNQIAIPEQRSWRKLLAYLGPGFLVCIAYIDPANFESDLQAGAMFQYELLWVLLLAAVGGFIIQSLAASLGVVTEKHLAEHCRAEYPPRLNWSLWVMAEVAIVASDIPEVIGTAFAFNMLFGLEVWIGVLVTGGSTLVVLGLQHYGVRKLEVAIAMLVVVIAACFMLELAYARPAPVALLAGIVTPVLRSSQATAIAISVFGANVMPHNLYLHSALVLSRQTARTNRGIRDGRLFNILEMILGMVLAFLINVSVIGTSGAICNDAAASPEVLDSCKHLDLNRAPILLKNTLGRAASTLYAVALLASGLSSCVTGTYAGQYVMQGFLELKIDPVYRNLLTRSVAIVPSLAVALVGGTAASGQLIIISSIVLAFELPYALIPLLKFTSNPMKMGPFVNHSAVTVGVWLLGLCVIAINVFFIVDLIIDFIHHTTMPRAPLAVLSILIFAALALYIASAAYLAFRKDTQVTFSGLEDFDSSDELRHMSGDDRFVIDDLSSSDGSEGKTKNDRQPETDSTKLIVGSHTDSSAPSSLVSLDLETPPSAAKYFRDKHGQFN
eukprot:jgi/Mesen1/9712/ME000069S09106